MATINQLRYYAKSNGAKLTYNRSIGMYQIIRGFNASEGVIPARDENGKLWLTEREINLLKSYV
jgi:hypothetical protein